MSAFIPNRPKRPLTPQESEAIAEMRNAFWDDYDTNHATPKEQQLSLAEWLWLTSLVEQGALNAERASGFGTPMPFVLCFDSTDKPSVVMVHPIHLPHLLFTDSGETDPLAEAKRIFHELDPGPQSAQTASPTG